jgi:hypothetical protein
MKRCCVTSLVLALSACAIEGDEVADDGLDEVSQAGGPGPDLVVQTVTNPPATAQPGSTITGGDTTRNAGARAFAAAPSRTDYFLSTDAIKSAMDRKLGARNVPLLQWTRSDAGTTTLTIPPNTASGTYFLIACADAGNAVVEMNETNNCRTAGATIAISGPDLRVTAVEDPPATGAIGQVITAGDTTQNQGQAASAATTLAYYLSTDTSRGADDVFLGTRTLAQLLAGSSQSGTAGLTIPAGTPGGVYRLLACADYPTSLVKETDEANNCLASAGTMGVDGGADLQVVLLGAPPASVIAGSSLQLDDTTANLGGASAGASTTRLYLSADAVLSGTDTLLGSRLVAALAPDEVHAFTGSYTVPSGLSGSFFVLACADRLDDVPESIETNNCRASSTTVAVSGPNLRVASLTPTPSPAVQGQAFTLDATVDNAGTAAAAASNVYYWLSTDAVKGTGDTVLTTGAAASVGAGASVQSLRTIIFPTTVAAGSYFLIPCADGGNLVPETDERDNCGAAVALTVTAAP